MKLPSSLFFVRSLLRQAVAARVVLLFVFHTVVFACAYALAWLLRFEFTIPADWAVTLKASLPVVVGVPGQIVLRADSSRLSMTKADLEHDRLPDTITETITALIAHVESLEKRVNGGGVYGPTLHAPEKGVWHGSDFSI